MYPILIIREEIICIIILLFLMCMERLYGMGKDHSSFIRLEFFGLTHVVFDIITVITVNNLDVVPGVINKVAHIIFYLSAILYAWEFFCYVSDLCLDSIKALKARKIASTLFVVYFVAQFFLKVTYTRAAEPGQIAEKFILGDGTAYSSGLGVYVGFSIAVLYFLGAAVLLLIKRRELAHNVKAALFPILIALFAAVIIQVLYPEFLFTGAIVTFTTVGFFFTLENPAYVFKRKMQTDALTGVLSRNCYETDIENYDKVFKRSRTSKFGLVFFDINNLKMVNDVFGHAEGDNYISTMAQILLSSLKHAENVYRMGGDEFLAIYVNSNKETIVKEITAVDEATAKFNADTDYNVSIAKGYAISGPEYNSLRDALSVADYNMYSNKAQMKARKIFHTDANVQSVDITGLTNRIFDAFALTDRNNYLYICNLETNVYRLSRSMVEYFKLPSEFIPNFMDVWLEMIHPDDRESFISYNNMLIGESDSAMQIKYRVKVPCKGYVECISHSSILHGTRGTPDLLAGWIVNSGTFEEA